MPRPDAPPMTRAVVLRGVMFALAIALGAVAVWLIVTGSTNPRRIEIGVLAGLWGLLIGAYSMFGARRGHADGFGSTELALRSGGGLEPAAQAEARRAFEERLEHLLRTEISSSVSREVGDLRDEVAALRQELVEKVGGQLRLERIETTRLIGSDLEALQAEVRQLKTLRGTATRASTSSGLESPAETTGPLSSLRPADVVPAAPAEAALVIDAAAAAEREKAERARVAAKEAAEKAERDRLERERLERERVERERLEREQAKRDRAERELRERLEQERRERAQREQAERERAERVQREQAEREKAQRERAERERAQREQAERERAQRQAAERERAQREQAEREKAQREQAEREKAQREQAERERAQREQAEREKAQREQAEQRDPFASLPRITPFTDFELDPVAPSASEMNGSHADPASGNGASPYTGRRRASDEIDADQQAADAGRHAEGQAGGHHGADDEPDDHRGGRRRRRGDDDDGIDLLSQLLSRDSAEH